APSPTPEAGLTACSTAPSQRDDASGAEPARMRRDGRFGLAPVDSTARARILAIWRQFTERNGASPPLLSLSPPLPPGVPAANPAAVRAARWRSPAHDACGPRASYGPQ